MEREIISRAEFARRMGISRAAVTQGIEKGVLDEGAALEDGQIAWPDAEQQWRANTNPAKRPDDKKSFNESRAEKEAAQAELAKIRLAEKRDELRPRTEIERAVTDCGIQFKRLVSGIPQWADEVAGESGGDALAARGVLKKKARELQKEMEQAMLRLV